MRQPLCIAGSLFLLATPVVGAYADADGAAAAQEASDDPVVRAMHDELDRSAAQLALPDAAKPYCISLRLDEQTSVNVSASFGALTRKQAGRARYLRAAVRVGDYALDNTNSAAASSFAPAGIEMLPIEDDYDAVRHDIWHATDLAYKQAAADYANKVAARKTQNQSADDTGDFSRESPSRIVRRRPAQALDLEGDASLVKGLSTIPKEFSEIQASEVAMTVTNDRRVLMTSEGTFADEDSAVTMLTATLRTQAPDGMPLNRVVSYSATSTSGLPAKDVLEREIRRAAQELSDERLAPEAEDYAGPVLFEGPAAATLVRDRIAPELSGAPAPKSDASSPMTQVIGSETEWGSKIGQRVMAAGLRVVDNPTIEHFGDLALIGAYAADDEGMAAQKVTLIENGLLEQFVMSGDRGLSAEELRQRLLAEVRATGQRYGLVVRLLDDPMATGDYTALFRRARGDSVPPPAQLVRVTVDGKEKPLRGGTFGQLPLRAFEEIIAVGNDPAVASSILGSSSSVVCPSLLFRRVEIKKPAGPQRKPPLLRHPYFAVKAP
jgi:TldD protein